MRSSEVKSAAVPLSVLLVPVLAATGSGCTDPVRDQQIAALGEETEGGPGPNHRPGQPCLLCHSEGGPASGKAFAVAGTIYKSSKAGAEGANEIFVQFKDASGGEPVVPAQSVESGNFWVPLTDWPDITFPVRVGLYKGLTEAPTAVMASLINREGSCNYCHKPNIDSGDLPSDKDERRKALQPTTESAGQIYLSP